MGRINTRKERYFNGHMQLVLHINSGRVYVCLSVQRVSVAILPWLGLLRFLKILARRAGFYLKKKSLHCKISILIWALFLGDFVTFLGQKYSPFINQSDDEKKIWDCPSLFWTICHFV